MSLPNPRYNIPNQTTDAVVNRSLNRGRKGALRTPTLKHARLFQLGIMALLVNRAMFGQAAPGPRNMTQVIAAPTITILPAAVGAMLRSQAANSASLDLGRVSYFRGTSIPGGSSQKKSGSFVTSTRFGLRVDCPGSSPSSIVNVTMSRLDAAPSHAISIDGTTVRPVAQTLVHSMPCGSAGEHRLDVEVPVSTPAGSIGSIVAFEATLR